MVSGRFASVVYCSYSPAFQRYEQHYSPYVASSQINTPPNLKVWRAAPIARKQRSSRNLENRRSCRSVVPHWCIAFALRTTIGLRSHDWLHLLQDIPAAAVTRPPPPTFAGKAAKHMDFHAACASASQPYSLHIIGCCLACLFSLAVHRPVGGQSVSSFTAAIALHQLYLTQLFLSDSFLSLNTRWLGCKDALGCVEGRRGGLVFFSDPTQSCNTSATFWILVFTTTFCFLYRLARGMDLPGRLSELGYIGVFVVGWETYKIPQTCLFLVWTLNLSRFTPPWPRLIELLVTVKIII